MTTEQFLHICIAILAFAGAGLSTWSLKMIFSLNDRVTIAEEKARSHKDETERRLVEKNLEIERRFQDRRDDRLQERVLFDLQLKSLNEKHEAKIAITSQQCDSQYIRVKEELVKLETSINAVHRRLDDFKSMAMKNGIER